MPIIKSAKKRVRVTQKASIKNAKTKKSLKESLKTFHAALSGKKDTTKAQNEAYSAIDTAVKKHVISKQKGARQKSQVNKASKLAGTTKVGSKKTTKAKSPKKATTAKKKTTKPKAKTKKTTAKKATAKK